MSFSITSRTGEAVFTVDQAKAYLNIASAFTGDDTLLADLVSSAIDIVETHNKIVLQGGTATYKSMTWHDAHRLGLSLGVKPVTSVVSVTYTDTDDVGQTLSSDLYYLDSTRTEVRIIYKSDTTLPECKEGTQIVVTVSVGYATASTVPPLYGQVLRHMVSEFYEHRANSPAEKMSIAERIMSLDRQPTF